MTDSELATTFRTHLCGALRDNDVGATVRLGGWVHRARDLGGLMFFDLRDRAGLVQVSIDLAAASPEVAQVARSLGAETVVLVEGVVAHRAQIDELIGEHALGWTLERMPVVDRNLLRIATFELLWLDDTPDAVVLSEAVKLATDLSTDDSPSFVNGVLAKLLEKKPQLQI